ncbi:MAG: hypothetical protein C0413_03745 [Clostridiales bacterium]|nr:hypothetical protein [Clostridiales bacterium]
MLFKMFRQGIDFHTKKEAMITNYRKPDLSTITIILCLVIVVVLSLFMVFTTGQREKTDKLDTGALQELADTIHSQYFFYEDKELDRQAAGCCDARHDQQA